MRAISMNALVWSSSIKAIQPSAEVYCQTRDIVQARIESIRSVLLQNEWDQSTTALIIAVMGELTSNVFDHNLGQWPDVPGCWFEFDLDQSHISMTVADRGRGVRSSLLRIRPGIDDREALRIAFSEHVTGRAPEKRGNGLKFVMNVLRGLPGVTFVYQSGAMILSYSTMKDQSHQIPDLLSETPDCIQGVYAKLDIQKSI